jgi:hypothetical protein
MGAAIFYYDVTMFTQDDGAYDFHNYAPAFVGSKLDFRVVLDHTVFLSTDDH